jgi:hypothetical protein
VRSTAASPAAGMPCDDAREQLTSSQEVTVRWRGRQACLGTEARSHGGRCGGIGTRAPYGRVPHAGIIQVSVHQQHVGATITALISRVNSNLRAPAGKGDSCPPWRAWRRSHATTNHAGEDALLGFPLIRSGQKVYNCYAHAWTAEP